VLPGAVQTLSQILSECKFGLHLILAHQRQSQLGDRPQGALENVQIKVISSRLLLWYDKISAVVMIVLEKGMAARNGTVRLPDLLRHS